MENAQQVKVLSTNPFLLNKRVLSLLELWKGKMHYHPLQQRQFHKRKFQKDPEDDENFKLFYSNKEIHGICKTVNVSDFVRTQQKRYVAHLVRAKLSMTIMLLFQEDKCTKRGRNTNTLFKH